VLRLLPELLRSFALSSGTLRLMTHMRNPAPLHVLLDVFVDPAHLGMQSRWGMRWGGANFIDGTFSTISRIFSIVISKNQHKHNSFQYQSIELRGGE
jgi:hypothetical protein